MTITEDDKKQQVMIGEATFNLIFNHQDVTPLSLVEQLYAMADREQDDDRLLSIWQARKWLQIFNKGERSGRRPDWLQEMMSRASQETVTAGDDEPVSRPASR